MKIQIEIKFYSPYRALSRRMRKKRNEILKKRDILFIQPSKRTDNKINKNF